MPQRKANQTVPWRAHGQWQRPAVNHLQVALLRDTANVPKAVVCPIAPSVDWVVKSNCGILFKHLVRNERVAKDVKQGILSFTFQRWSAPCSTCAKSMKPLEPAIDSTALCTLAKDEVGLDKLLKDCDICLTHNFLDYTRNLLK